MIKYNVTGMTCAACSARVEKAVSAINGVSSCSVNLLTNSMNVEGNASTKSIIDAVVKAGYGASVAEDDNSFLENKNFKNLIKRLALSFVFLAPLMYLSMGHMMWGWKIPAFLRSNHLFVSIVQMVLASIIMFINKKFFTNGFRGLINKAPNMDSLVALGSGASYVYSIVAMVRIAVKSGVDSMEYMNHLYFESAAMILVLITVGKALEAYSKGKTTNAISSLIKLAPKNSVIIKDNKEIVIETRDVKIGDIVVVKPGERVSVDGIVIEGATTIDESALTGESMPVDKEKGDPVSAGTINKNGYIRFKATRVGQDTTLSQVIKMVADASATKAPISKVADKVSGVFVPIVMAIALATFIVWMIISKDLAYSLSRGISVLVISCPCALGLATPVAIMVGNGVGARNGILFKTAASLEETGRVQIVALDKTGTITSGHPVVTDVIPLNNHDEAKLISLAYSLEYKSEHPLARAIVDYASQNSVAIADVISFEAVTGNGIKGVIDKCLYYGGSKSFIEGVCSIPSDVSEYINKLSSEGKTPLLFATESSIMGIIAVADDVKDDSAQAVNQLHNMGIRVVMLTGDNSKTANAIAEKVGVDYVISNMLPEDKEKRIRELQQSGKVAMVGDGINDSPALTRADVGIAINSGTDIAIESADIVLINNNLTDVAAAIRLSKATLRNIKENLLWAFIYNVLGIPLAMGVFIGITGWTLSPMFGAAAMSLSSVCVVSNALRLNLVNIHSNKHFKNNKQIDINIKETKTMKKIFNVEGMMCMHCEAHVKTALEAIDGIESVVASHEKKQVEIELSKDVDDSIIKSTIENEGYKVL